VCKMCVPVSACACVVVGYVCVCGGADMWLCRVAAGTSDSCKVCASHYTSDGGASECRACRAGTEHPASLMAEDPAVYVCVECTDNSVSAEGQACITCPNGHVANFGKTECVQCTAVRPSMHCMTCCL